MPPAPSNDVISAGDDDAPSAHEPAPYPALLEGFPPFTGSGRVENPPEDATRRPVELAAPTLIN